MAHYTDDDEHKDREDFYDDSVNFNKSKLTPFMKNYFRHNPHKSPGTIKAELQEMNNCPKCARSRMEHGYACKFHRDHACVNFQGREPSSYRNRRDT